jgi:hypothetical protein
MSGAHPYRDRPSAATHVWLTPPDILQELGQFDLDPCAAPEPRPWPTARQHYVEADDGLSKPWHGRVWLNPPYGSHAGAWMERMAQHRVGIALLFARTDTLVFHRHVWPYATGLLFLSGRPHFHLPTGERAKGNSGGPIVLVAYGDADADVLERCNLPGHYVPNANRWAA